MGHEHTWIEFTIVRRVAGLPIEPTESKDQEVDMEGRGIIHAARSYVCQLGLPISTIFRSCSCSHARHLVGLTTLLRLSRADSSIAGRPTIRRREHHSLRRLFFSFQSTQPRIHMYVCTFFSFLFLSLFLSFSFFLFFLLYYTNVLISIYDSSTVHMI